MKKYININDLLKIYIKLILTYFVKMKFSLLKKNNYINLSFIFNFNFFLIYFIN